MLFYVFQGCENQGFKRIFDFDLQENQSMVLRFKWLCDDIDLDVDNKDKVILLHFIMDWEDKCTKNCKIMPDFLHLHMFGK